MVTTDKKKEKGNAVGELALIAGVTVIAVAIIGSIIGIDAVVIKGVATVIAGIFVAGFVLVVSDKRTTTV